MKRRELVVRVATLELLVSDLLHALREVSPQTVERLAEDAATDRDGQACRSMPDGSENQRFRLHQVLDERVRRLKHKRFSTTLRHQRFEATD